HLAGKAVGETAHLGDECGGGAVAAAGGRLGAGVAQDAAVVEEPGLDAGAADVDGEDGGTGSDHGVGSTHESRITERVRLRGLSGSSPSARARARATRWARTRSAIGSMSLCSNVPPIACTS